jgi:hypothetical protein
VIPTTPGSTTTRFCHLRTDYFHPVALAVGGPVEAALEGLIGLARDDRADAAAAQQPAVGAAAVGLMSM